MAKIDKGSYELLLESWKDFLTEDEKDFRMGEWPQPHSLRMDDSSARVYILYSGGETSFSPEAYKLAGSRAYMPARIFIGEVWLGKLVPAVSLPESLLYRAAYPPIPEKHGEKWAFIAGLRKLGRQTPRMDEDLTWTQVHWLAIRLALALCWNTV